MLSSGSVVPRSESRHYQKPGGLTINTTIPSSSIRLGLQTMNSYASVEWIPHISRYQSWRPMSTPSSNMQTIVSNPGLTETRSIKDLRFERLYLLNSLRHENEKATNLLTRILPLEGVLAQDGISQVRRRMRKQLGWLRHRLNETNRQQQAVMIRLNQLNDEISVVERSYKAEFERCQYQLLHENAMAAMRLLHLDPTTPSFQPQGYIFPRIESLNVKGRPSKSRVLKGASTAACENVSPHTKTIEDPADELSPIRGEFENCLFSRRPSSFDSTAFEALFNEFRPEPVMRRQSLPYIPGLSDIWTSTKKEEEEEEEEEEGVGSVAKDRKADWED
ncbi:hypothetical protein BJ875DRAFT_530871 [Amylocarpus encephaloides]|uniref:Uncharacterized protein n=1 Tax=Amylocarpus encephaloides TaxID=45428 RepID=A0A9P7Y4X7_9HELO|nr:hypothetical protein BJ875DRAFT_530871 [Amylocarpus encephaloides]